MRARARDILRVGAVCVLAGALAGGCATKQRTGSTRFTVSDVEFSAGELRRELLAAELLAGRSRDSQPFVIMAGDAVNLSSERLPEADRWGVVSMILYDPEVRAAFEATNVFVHLTPEKRMLFRRYVLPGSSADPYDLPADTHLFNVAFRSIQRAAAVAGGVADARKDVFVVDAQITDLATGRVVWSGETSFARQARGLLLD
ncbi:MAG: hypothetical protein DHS20C14_00220 [Phycisphaeraceae bacterium]|nr:MAG: hypothetical protein DHS20C14_00220 [Phycisphaeraceae bacterium]